MKSVEVPLPLLVAVAGTRALLGLGAGLLLADSVTSKVRRPLGWSLLAIGVLSTIPLGASVLSRRRRLPR